MKQIPLLQGKALLIEMPEGAKDPFVAKTYIDEDGHTYDTDPQWIEWSGTYPNSTIDLPPGNWRIIGMLSEVTEMDAIPLVDKERFIVDGPDLGFRNYKGNKYDWFGTAIESLYSAIEAAGWHFDNPYVDPGLIPSFELERFREAQSRVLCRERCLLLIKR